MDAFAGRRSRLRADRRDRRVLARLRRDARAAAPPGGLAVGPTTTASTRRQPPFDDVRVRQAFGEAVDWRRMAALGGSGRRRPRWRPRWCRPGSPGGATRDFVPRYDPARRAPLLAEAGYPGGSGFPAVTILMTGGSGFDEAIVTELKRELGVTLQAETMGDGYFDRLATDPPAMWSLAWVADYPGRNDFLGVLLASSATNNYGRWSSPEFDAAIAEAGAATDPATASAAYDRAEDIVQRDVAGRPGRVRDGLGAGPDGPAGAGQNGLGIVAVGRAGVGGSDAAAVLGRCSSSPLGCCWVVVPGVAGPAADPDVRDADDRRRPSGRDRPHPAGDARRAAGTRRGAADLRRRDRPARLRGPAADDDRRRRPCATPLNVTADGHILPEHAARRRAGAITAGDGAAPVVGPGGQDRLRRRPLRLEDRSGRLVRVHWYEGDDGVRRSGARDRRGRRRGDVGAPRRHRDRARRLLRLRRPGRVLRRPRARARARTSAARPTPRSGRCSRSITPGQIDDPLGRRASCPTSSSISSSTRPRRTRTTSRRAGSTRAWRSTRARATAPSDRARSSARPAAAT